MIGWKTLAGVAGSGLAMLGIGAAGTGQQPATERLGVSASPQSAVASEQVPQMRIVTLSKGKSGDAVVIQDRSRMIILVYHSSSDKSSRSPRL